MRFIAPLALVACDLDLPDEGFLDRTRLLAARTEPAQPAAGEPFTLTSLAFAPTGAPTVVWCVPFSECGPHDPLVAELAALDWPALDEANRAEWRALATAAGIVGVEPGLPVEGLAPDLEGFDELLLEAYAIPPVGDDVEVARLTIPLARAAANQHPTLAAVEADGSPVDALDVAVGQTVALEVTWPEGAFEVDEVPDVRWYTDAPRRESAPALGDPGPYTLTVDAAFDGVVAVVVRDGRGGVDWRVLPLTVRR